GQAVRVPPAAAVGDARWRAVAGRGAVHAAPAAARHRAGLVLGALAGLRRRAARPAQRPAAGRLRTARGAVTGRRRGCDAGPGPRAWRTPADAALGRR